LPGSDLVGLEEQIISRVKQTDRAWGATKFDHAKSVGLNWPPEVEHSKQASG
jgi:hypothetical protein